MHESWIITLHFPSLPTNPQSSLQTSTTREYDRKRNDAHNRNHNHNHKPNVTLATILLPAQLFTTTTLNQLLALILPASVTWSSEAAPQPWLINQPDPKKTSRRHP